MGSGVAWQRNKAHEFDRVFVLAASTVKCRLAGKDDRSTREGFLQVRNPGFHYSLAQTGFFSPADSPGSVAPDRAGRANCERSELSPAEMPEISLSQGKIYYETHGKGEPLVGLHHGMSSSRAWKNQIGAFARHFAFIIYDRLGHGRSEHHLSYEQGYFENRASELGELITYLGLDSVHLCGMCEGGAIALVFASSWPKNVKTLICQGVGYFTTDETVARCEKHFQAWSRVDVSLRHQLIGHHGKEYAMLKWEALREAKPYVWSPSYDLRARFSGVQAPTLIMAGDKDRFFDMEQAIAASRGIKNSQLCIMPETGHFPNEKAPGVFNRIVLDFLTKHTNSKR